MYIHQVLKAQHARRNLQDTGLVQGACCDDVHIDILRCLRQMCWAVPKQHLQCSQQNVMRQYLLPTHDLRPIPCILLNSQMYCVVLVLATHGHAMDDTVCQVCHLIGELQAARDFSYYPQIAAATSLCMSTTAQSNMLCQSSAPHSRYRVLTKAWKWLSAQHAPGWPQGRHTHTQLTIKLVQRWTACGRVQTC